MPFPLTITTPSTVVTLSISADIEPTRCTVAFNPILTSYHLEPGQGEAAITHIEDALDSNQTLTAVLDFLRGHGYDPVTINLIRQGRPPNPWHFEPHVNPLAQPHGAALPRYTTAPTTLRTRTPSSPRSPTPAPLFGSTQERGRTRFQTPPSLRRVIREHQASPGNRPRHVLRRGTTPGPSRSNPNLPR